MTVALHHPESASPAVRQVAAGLATGFDHIGLAAALGALVFAGPLAGGAQAGTILFLLASLVPTALLALDRTLPAPIFENVQNAPIAILMPAVLAAGAGIASASSAVATVGAILGGTAVLSGVSMLLMARFDLGRLVRLMPFPVSCGFLAASGTLLIISALGSVIPADVSALASLGPDVAGALFVPGLTLGFALAMGIAVALAPNLGMITVLVGGLAITHGALALLGVPQEEARALGILREMAEAAGPGLPPLALAGEVEWSVVRDAAPLMGVATLVALIGCMLNLTGIELLHRRDVATRRVLARCGASNIVLGAAGCSVGFVSASSTSMGVALGGPGRITSLTVCAMMGLGVLFVSDIVAVIPPFMAAGLLVWVGASILNRFLLSQRGMMGRVDWLLAAAIVAITLAFGMLTAVGVGIVAASLIFAVSYARLPVIRASSDLTSRRSRVDRGPAQTAFLDDAGGQVAVVSLQGYLFFGSVEQLAEHVRMLFDGDPPARVVILDLARVRQIDAAAIAAFRKLSQLAQARAGRVVLADMSPDVARSVARGALFGEGSALEPAGTTDAALEAAETELLARMEPPEAREDAASALTRLLDSADLAGRLLDRMAREQVARGDALIRRGETTQDVFLIDSGRLAVQAPGPDGQPTRLRSMRAGALVGEMASYAGLPRSADVIAETDVVLYRANPSMLATMGKRDPELAAAWHRMIAITLAEKLHRTNQILGEQR